MHPHVVRLYDPYICSERRRTSIGTRGDSEARIAWSSLPTAADTFASAQQTASVHYSAIHMPHRCKRCNVVRKQCTNINMQFIVFEGTLFVLVVPESATEIVHARVTHVSTACSSTHMCTYVALDFWLQQQLADAIAHLPAIARHRGRQRHCLTADRRLGRPFLLPP